MEQQKTGQEPNWTYKPENNDASINTSNFSPPEVNQTKKQDKNQSSSVSWTASEFAENHKSVGWYATLFAIIFTIAGLTYFFTRDWISAITISIVGILFAVLAGKKPRQMSYRIDSSGITIGEKHYPYSMFKSFSISEEGAIGCINLMPLKRFMPELSIYYPPEEEQKIIEVLSISLPNEQREDQSFDKFMKKIRF